MQKLDNAFFRFLRYSDSDHSHFMQQFKLGTKLCTYVK
jgi:hypothetical protein